MVWLAVRRLAILPDGQQAARSRPGRWAGVPADGWRAACGDGKAGQAGRRLCGRADGQWVAGMVRTMKELSDVFEVLKMLSVLYLLRYGLLLMLFFVGLLGFFEKDPNAL